MAMNSDVVYDLSAFTAEKIHPSTDQLNKTLIERGKGDKKWWEVSV
jgi:hypothetical protein